jgi:hypothetical protein
LAHAQVHAVQTFIPAGRLGITPGSLMHCPSAEAAKRLAERLVREERASGALAFSTPGPGSADEYSQPTFLARVGEVPESDEY